MDEIIKRFREGNQRAFEELFWGFFSAGRQFVKSFQVDDSSADDILQEVFIHIWINDKLSRVKIILRLIFIKR